MALVKVRAKILRKNANLVPCRVNVCLLNYLYVKIPAKVTLVYLGMYIYSVYVKRYVGVNALFWPVLPLLVHLFCAIIQQRRAKATLIL